LGDTSNTSTWGTTVANVGDINHDGWDDLAVGYPFLDLGSGVVYIYYGYREMDGVADLVLHHSDVWPVVGYLFGDHVGPAGDFVLARNSSGIFWVVGTRNPKGTPLRILGRNGWKEVRDWIRSW